jgi:hypothetical protein
MLAVFINDPYMTGDTPRLDDKSKETNLERME